jgi:hypothetical protein
MGVRNSFGQNLSGYAYDEDTDLFSDDVTGIATYPSWSMTTSSCAIRTLGSRCGAVAFLLDGLPAFSLDDPLPDTVTGAVEFRWSGPACTTRWEGYWER